MRRGAAASRKCRRSPPLTPQTGWWLTSHISVRATNPAAPSEEASRHFLNVASTPPHEEGTTPPAIFSIRCHKALSSRLFVILVGIRISAPLVIDIVKDGTKESFRFEIFDGVLEQLTGSLPCANHEEYLVGKASQ